MDRSIRRRAKILASQIGTGIKDYIFPPHPTCARNPYINSEIGYYVIEEYDPSEPLRGGKRVEGLVRPRQKRSLLKSMFSRSKSSKGSGLEKLDDVQEANATSRRRGRGKAVTLQPFPDECLELAPDPVPVPGPTITSGRRRARSDPVKKLRLKSGTVEQMDTIVEEEVSESGSFMVQRYSPDSVGCKPDGQENDAASKEVNDIRLGGSREGVNHGNPRSIINLSQDLVAKEAVTVKPSDTKLPENRDAHRIVGRKSKFIESLPEVDARDSSHFMRQPYIPAHRHSSVSMGENMIITPVGGTSTRYQCETEDLNKEKSVGFVIPDQLEASTKTNSAFLDVASGDGGLTQNEAQSEAPAEASNDLGYISTLSLKLSDLGLEEDKSRKVVSSSMLGKPNPSQKRVVQEASQILAESSERTMGDDDDDSASYRTAYSSFNHAETTNHIGVKPQALHNWISEGNDNAPPSLEAEAPQKSVISPPLPTSFKNQMFEDSLSTLPDLSTFPFPKLPGRPSSNPTTTSSQSINSNRGRENNRTSYSYNRSTAESRARSEVFQSSRLENETMVFEGNGQSEQQARIMRPLRMRRRPRANSSG